MEIGKSESLFGDLVDVGRADLSAEAAYIGETEVIGDYDEEVGAFSRHCQEGIFENRGERGSVVSQYLY